MDSIAHQIAHPITPRGQSPPELSCYAPGRNGGLSYSEKKAPDAPRKPRWF